MPESTKGRKPFTAWLQEQRRGGLANELSDALAELAKAVCETGKKGTLTLQVALAPNGVDAVSVGDKVTLKLPTPEAGQAIFFVDEGGNLSRNDPRQPKLPMDADDLADRREETA